VLYTAAVGTAQQTSEWSEGTSGCVLYTATTVDTVQQTSEWGGLSVVQLWHGTILDSGIKSSEERLIHR